MNRIIKGYFYVILSAILFGCLPLAANIAYDNGLNALNLVFYRNLLAIPILYFFVRLKGEMARLSSREEFLKISSLSIIGCCITPVLLFSSYNFIPAGTSTTFHFIYPAMTILGGVVLFRQRVGKGQILCVLLCTLGVALFYEPGGDLDLFGSALALISGVTYALYIILLDHFRMETISRFKLSLHIAIVCAGATLVLCLVTDNFALPANALCWGVCLLMALFCGAAANVLFQQGTLMIGGQRASILCTFEPITSIVTGVLIFGDPFSLRAAAGTACVLIATVGIALLDVRAKGQIECGDGPRLNIVGDSAPTPDQQIKEDHHEPI